VAKQTDIVSHIKAGLDIKPSQHEAENVGIHTHTIHKKLYTKEDKTKVIPVKLKRKRGTCVTSTKTGWHNI